MLCPNCQTENEVADAWAYCSQCGGRLPYTPPEKSAEREDDSYSRERPADSPSFWEVNVPFRSVPIVVVVQGGFPDKITGGLYYNIGEVRRHTLRAEWFKLWCDRIYIPVIALAVAIGLIIWGWNFSWDKLPAYPWFQIGGAIVLLFVAMWWSHFSIVELACDDKARADRSVSPETRLKTVQDGDWEWFKSRLQ